MRREAPHRFDIKSFFQGIFTFQGWELFPGHRTNGKDVVGMMRNLGVPEDLTGCRVLDIAPWNGYFGFECVRRGAAEVVSFGPDDPDLTGYNKVKDLLEIDNCTYVRSSVYDLRPSLHGRFDHIMFLGVIYHLRHPLLALDRIYDAADGRLYVDSPVIDRACFDRTISQELRQRILTEAGFINELPMLYYTPGIETGDAYNWFMPNLKALCALVSSSGFAIDHVGDDGGEWAWLSANKGTRAFSEGLEGFNPGASGYGSNN